MKVPVKSLAHSDLSTALSWYKQVNPVVESSVDFTGLRLSAANWFSAFFFFLRWLSNTGDQEVQYHTFLFLCAPFFFPILLTKTRNKIEKEVMESADWFLNSDFYAIRSLVSYLIHSIDGFVKCTHSVQPSKGLARAEDPHSRPTPNL